MIFFFVNLSFINAKSYSKERDHQTDSIWYAQGHVSMVSDSCKSDIELSCAEILDKKLTVLPHSDRNV